MWQYKYNHGAKYNTYTLYVKAGTHIPVYYEMLGYDSLLGSHFDEYKIRYGVYAEDYPSDVFDKPITGKYVKQKFLLWL